MLNIALVGIGKHARRNLLPALRDASELQLAALSTRNPTVLAEAASEYGCVGHGSLQQVLDDPNVDAVLLATPTGCHADQIERCLDAGKHVFCEKSLTSRNSDSQRLLDRAAHRGLLLAEMFMFVHHPQWQALEELVRSGRIGAPRSMSAWFGFPHLPQPDIRYNPRLGGGALLDAGAYTLAAARRILGEVDVLGSSVRTGQAWHVDTEGAALLRGANGATATLQWGFGRSYRNEVDVWFEEGRVRLDRAFSKPPSLATSVWIQHQSDNTVESIAIEPANHFVRMLDAFATSIEAGNQDEWLREASAQSELLSAVRRTS